MFVVGISSNNLVVQQYDGKVGKTLLTEADGLQEPTLVFYYKENNLSLVCNKQNTAFSIYVPTAYLFIGILNVLRWHHLILMIH